MALNDKKSYEGHRARVKEKFLKGGFTAATPDYEILEMLLFYAVPRIDTKDTAKALLARFGNMAGVMNASVPSLCEVSGIKENTAILIKLSLEMAKAYSRSMNETGSIMRSSEEFGTYLINQYAFHGSEEFFSMISLDAKGQFKNFKVLETGDIDSVGVSLRKIIEEVLATKASAVVLAHNHPSGIALPSDTDVRVTVAVQSALEAVGVHLLDHIILSGGDFISMYDSKKFKQIFKIRNNI